MISRNFIIKSAAGGTLDVVSSEGEVVQTFSVPAGRHRASQWTDLLDPGESLRPGKGVTASLGRRGVSLQRSEDYAQSDANPDYQPPPLLDQLVSNVSRQLAILSATNRANAARQRKAAQLQSIPVAPVGGPAAEPEADVVE